MLIPSIMQSIMILETSLSRRVNANSQQVSRMDEAIYKLIKKGEC